MSATNRLPTSETDRLARVIRYMLLVFAVIILVETLTPIWWLASADDTDASNERSGMILLTDHGTGCQYLSRLGGLTPRLDTDGRHICDGGQAHD